MQLQKSIAVGLAVLAGAVIAAGAYAGGGRFGGGGILYGATGGGSPSDLFSIDPNTAATHDIGPTGHALTGLAVDPTTGVVYGATSANDPANPASLVTVNPSTGATSVIGQFSTAEDGPIAEIAFDGSGQLYGWSEAVDGLARIDKTTAVVTPVGEADLSTRGDGMSFDKNGVLYDMSKNNNGALWTVDTTTGHPTTVATLTGSPGNAGSPIGAASFGCDGTTLWAASNHFGDNGFLLTVDTSTGAVTSHGQLPNGTDALTWLCGSTEHAGYCAKTPLPRGDGTTGIFQDLVLNQPSSDPTYAGATLALYGKGYGITCDNLAGLGFTDSGKKVNGQGATDPDPNENIYEYWTK